MCPRRRRVYCEDGSGPAVGAGPLALLGSPLGPGGAADELVRTVRLDLEDVELPVQRVVRLRRPAEGAAEEPVRDAHLLDLADHVAAFRELALAGAPRLLDPLAGDLGG